LQNNLLKIQKDSLEKNIKAVKVILEPIDPNNKKEAIIESK